MAKAPESGRQKPLPKRVTGDLSERIAAAKRDQVEMRRQPEQSAAQMQGMNRAIRLGAEFIAAILVGSGIGFLLDLWLGTKPWIMLVMLLVGFAAGILNVVRSVDELNKASPPPPGSDLGSGDEEDDR